MALCGSLGIYNKNLDRVNVKAEKPLQRFENVKLFNVSTSDDPMIQELIQKHDDIQVLATDQILAVLMAARSSVYSWDIVITKLGNKIFFDKRDGSHIDFLTCNETSNDPPSNEDKESINAPMRLGQEATCINQNFSQMVLDSTIPEEQQEFPNPFDDDEEEDGCRVASGAYRYRKITLPGNDKETNEWKKKPIAMLVRTEVNAKMSTAKDAGYVYARALNEFDPKAGLAWRAHLESQRGAVLASELKNNAFKLARWVGEAILSGCTTMKIGYASRSAPNDNWAHSLLNVQTYQTAAFATNIGMTETNAYGVLRSIIDVVGGMEDGKYLLLKDPTKPVVRLYELPWEAFEEGEEDGEKEEDAIPEEEEEE